MTRMQHEWVRKTGYNEHEYTAHLEDAFLRLCETVNPFDAMAVAWDCINRAEIDDNTGESARVTFTCQFCACPLEDGRCLNCAYQLGQT